MNAPSLPGTFDPSGCCTFKKAVIKRTCKPVLSFIKSGLLVILVSAPFLVSSQVATNYTFSQSAGTYVAISGGTVFGSSASNNMDDEISRPVIIPPFTFDGVVYTNLFINTNGYITFGRKSPSPSSYRAISDTIPYKGAVAAFSADLNAASGIADIRYLQSGSEFIIQWQNVSRAGIVGEHISFQVRLNSSDNRITIVYGGTITPGIDESYPEIGLRGPDNTFATNVNNRSVISTTGAWLNSTAGTSNTSTCYFNTLNAVTKPAAGTTFTWTPPALDLQAATLALPGTSGCYGTNETVSATIRNSGSGTIDFSSSPATVSGNVTGPNPVTFTPVVINSGTLAPNVTQTIILSSSYNMSLAGNYTFNASVSVIGDGYNTNDAMQPVLRESHTPAVVASQDVTICAGQSTGLNSTATSYSFIRSLSNTTPLPIPDNLPAGVNSTISVAGTAIAASLASVRIDYLAHTYDGDLILKLKAPDGSSILLSNEEGGGGENFINTLFSASAVTPISAGVAPFTGTFLPENPFSLLTGPANGIWTLNVSDIAGADLGSLLGWTLIFPIPNSVASYNWNPSSGLSSAVISNPGATPDSTTIYVVTVTDAGGCTGRDSVTVNVNQFPEVNPPTVTQPNCLLTGIIEVNATGNGVLEYSLNAGAFQASSTFSSLAPGNYNIAVRLQSNPGCESSYSSNPVVINPPDNEKPGITCPANVNVSNDAGTCAAIINIGQATATDNCPGSIAITGTRDDSAPLADPFQLGTTVITWTATDGFGNTDSCQQTILVYDGENPIIVCPPDIVVSEYPAGSGYANVNPGLATASDNCSSVNIAGIRSDALALNATYPVGSTTILWMASDASGNTDTCHQFIHVQSTVSTIIYTGDTAVQYSDNAVLRAVLTDQFSNVPLVGKTVTFNTGFQSMSAITNALGIASANFVNYQNPGSYLVSTVFLGDGIYSGSTDADLLRINKEDAEVIYTGPEFLHVSCSNCNTTSILLSASIKDITSAATPGDPNRGDIRKARVRFVNADNNIPITSWMQPGLVSSSDSTRGTISYTWMVSIPSTGYIDPYTIRIEVDSGNYIGSTEVVINVSRSSLPDFLSGGGYIIPTLSTGQYASDPLKKTNFGFNLKCNNSGQNLQGKINVVFRRTQSGTVRIYQLKGNLFNSLSVNNTSSVKNALFTCRVTLKDVTNPRSPVSLGTNLILQVKATDRGSPGTNDSIGFTLWNNNNVLLYSSNWISTGTVPKNLASGNIIIRTGNNNNNNNNNNNADDDDDDGERMTSGPATGNPVSDGDPLHVLVMPNPSMNYFTFITEGRSNDPILMRIIDISGKVMETKNLITGETVEIGNEYLPGIYFVEIRQRENLQTVKILKQQ